MFKVLGGDRKEYGPVTADDVRRWIAEGRLNAQSQVLPEGSAEWKPLSSLPEFAEALNAKAGQPSAAQPTTPPVDPAVWTTQILARQPQVQIGRCLSRSWELLRSNFGVLFGATFLIWLIGTVCERIPLIGLGYEIMQGVFYGGLYMVFLHRIRGLPETVGGAFAGFSASFAQLLLAGFLTALLGKLALVCCLVIPGVYLLVAWKFSVPLVIDKRLEFWSAMELSRKVVTRVWFEMFGLLVLAFLPLILVALFADAKLGSFVLSHVLPDIRDLLDSPSANPTHWFHLLKRFAHFALPYEVLLKLVLLVNLPFALGAVMYAYEDLFGPRPAPAA